MSDFEKMVNRLEWAITGIATFGNEFWDRPQIPRSKAWEETRAALLSAIAELEAERDELKEAGRWIPVEERLPEGPFQVQVWGRAIGNLGEKYAWCRNTAYFDMDGNWLHEWYTEKCEITHWMLLPQPPEVKHE